MMSSSCISDGGLEFHALRISLRGSGPLFSVEALSPLKPGPRLSNPLVKSGGCGEPWR